MVLELGKSCLSRSSVGVEKVAVVGNVLLSVQYTTSTVVCDTVRSFDVL